MSQDKKRIREAFRNAVFGRDGHACRACGIKNVPLDAHHITDRNLLPNGGYVKENGITLCNTPGGCHEKAECYHSGKPVPDGFLPTDLYKLIKSSYEQAVKASSKLK